MTIEAPPVWLQGGTYPARLDRFLIAQMYDEGVMGRNDCKVTQRGAGANFSVDIAVGSFIIAGDDQALQGNYLGRVTATENVAVSAAPGSNSRYDLVTLRVNDPNAGGNAGNTVTAVVVAGTASGSPVVPSLPASSIPIAVIGPIATATASITNALIQDWTNGPVTTPSFASSCRLLAGPRAPTGEMRMMATSAHYQPVSGWLYCNGQAVSRTTYAALFTEVGTGYGAGNGSTTFNVPDLRGRTPVAFDPTLFPTIGATGGEITHVLTASEMPVHAHSTNTAAIGASAQSGAGVNAVTSGSQNTGNAGSGAAHENMPPYQVVAGWMIRT